MDSAIDLVCRHAAVRSRRCRHGAPLGIPVLARSRPAHSSLWAPDPRGGDQHRDRTHRGTRRCQQDDPHMMDIASVTVGFLILLGAMTLGLHIATVMFGVGFIGAALYLGWPGANAMVVV